MEPGLIFLAAVAAWVVAVLWDGRRSAKGDNRLTWVVHAPLLFSGLAMIWAGITMASSHLALGGGLALVGAITTVLVARALRAAPAGYMSEANARGLPGQWFDYLIWTALGVPIVISILVLAMAIADRFNRS